jgi:hypothetical protein
MLCPPTPPVCVSEFYNSNGEKKELFYGALKAPTRSGALHGFSKATMKILNALQKI